MWRLESSYLTVLTLITEKWKKIPKPIKLGHFTKTALTKKTKSPKPKKPSLQKPKPTKMGFLEQKPVFLQLCIGLTISNKTRLLSLAKAKSVQSRTLQ